jgi:polysaccharide export outer membrane protein
LVKVSVFDVPEMAQTIRVNDMGDATLTLVGSLHLAGLTTDEAQASIAQKLKADNLLVDPEVSVFISEYSTQGVSVLGEVTKPGVYQVLGSRTLLDIISEAGGITPFAGSEATVKHVDGTTVTVRLTKDAQASLSADVQLAPGDKVLIPRAGLVYVLGDVGRPGGFIMGNDGKMTLLQAVAMAGGINHTSSMNRSRLIRKGVSGYTETAVPLKKILEGNRADIQLQTEDILYIPPNSAKSLIYRTGPSVTASIAGAAIYRGFP